MLLKKGEILLWPIVKIMWSCVLLGVSSCLYSAQSHPIKLLVLIIASDGSDLYIELQKHWRAYMHSDPEHIESYFLKSDPHLLSEYAIIGDTIWVKTEENVIPGLGNKTIGAMEALLPRIEKEFDFVLRTNLSSFYVFPNLLRFLERCPRTRFYGSGGVNHWYGYNNDYFQYGHGCGILFSPDVVKFMVEHRSQLWNQRDCDDGLFAKFLLYQHGYPLSVTERVDLLDWNDWYLNQHCIPLDVYHFRVRYHDHLNKELYELFIHEKLLRRYYPTAKVI